ncbi:MAG: diguanylate cyclase [Campylobacterales bacterium]|nr:diguanylate cyclase [Campylobacterales bacterium]
MSFLHRLSFKAKLLILTFFILISLAIIAGVGFQNIQSMKERLDRLYFGALMPTTQLHTMLHLYRDRVEITLLRAPELPALHGISVALSEIKKNWHDYASSYKEPGERPFIDYTSGLIESSERAVLSLLESCGTSCSDASVHALLKILEPTQQALLDLIRYENDVARFERQKLLQSYDTTLFRFTVVMIGVMLMITFLSLLVFRSINRTQIALQQTTQQLKRSNKKLEEASYTDTLTTLYNRRYFNIIFERELARAKRTKSVIVFMMLDIDYFKQYNDTYGHLEGDNALKATALALKALLRRPGDYLFRLGGEEFGVLLVDTDAHNAKTVAAQILERIRALEIPHASSKVHDHLTVSVGVVYARAHEGLSGDQLMGEADKELYSAKEQGRNRFCLRQLS